MGCRSQNLQNQQQAYFFYNLQSVPSFRMVVVVGGGGGGWYLRAGGE